MLKIKNKQTKQIHNCNLFYETNTVTFKLFLENG